MKLRSSPGFVVRGSEKKHSVFYISKLNLQTTNYKLRTILSEVKS